jgi:Mg-chelatase subunit ChlD
MNTRPTTHIYFLLDRSGSMARIADDVIGGFNTFLRQQQQEGPDARITLVQFDSRDPQHVVLNGAPITKATPLSHRSFVPRGGTPLLDATGFLIEKALEASRSEASQARTPNVLDRWLRPLGLREPFGEARSEPPVAEHILFVTLTDGEENQSRHFSLADIRERIAERTVAGWAFLFLSAGPDAYGEARRMGIARDSTVSFYADSEGTQQAMDHISRSAVAFRRERRGGVGKMDET